MAPFYIYYCEKCKTEFEELFSMKNKPNAITCAKCGGTAHSQIASGHFVINGASAANRYSGESNYRWLGDKPKK
jgi:putative FmdB family regulatory protein